MNIRSITSADTEDSGRVIYQAFCGIADRHNFPHDFPSAGAAVQLAEMAINSPDVIGFVAEDDGKFIGSNFLWKQNVIAGVGPITVEPGTQSKGVGRKLMEAVIESGKDSDGIRLVQDAFNTASMSLYASMGFDVVEPLVIMQGSTKDKSTNGVEIRPIGEEDFEACSELCLKVHGFNRLNELKATAQMLPAFVAVREGRVVAYASAPILWNINHAVAETTEDMQALLTGANALTGQPLSFLLPTRQAALFRWCLAQGLRVVKPLTLMVMGSYQEPQGCYLPSVLY